MSLLNAPPTGKAAPARRGFWPMRDLPTAIWLVLTVIAVAVHREIPFPRWLMIHLLLLGAITHAILVWSQYFSYALLRTRATVAERRTQNIRLTLSNLGAVLICFGIPTQVWAVTLAGVALLVTAVLWHAVSIFLRSRKSLAGRFGRTVHYYIASAALLTVGAVLGAIIARGDASNLVLAHAVLNVFGWIGVTVAGTLVTLWPTILRTKADDHATTGAVRALPALVAGVLTAAAGFVFELMSVVALGLAAYLAGLLLISVSLWRAARRAAPESFAALSVGAAFVWWIGITAVLLVAAVTAAITGSGHESLSDLFRQAVPYLVAGFAAQVLIGALSYLIPVVLGGGPTPVRVGTIAFDRLGMLRVCVANLALGVCALPVSSVMRVVASLLYFIAVASFLVVMWQAMRAQRRARQTQDVPRQPIASVKPGRRSGQAMAGFITVMLAVAVTAAADPVGLGWGNSAPGAADAPVQTVEVEAANMRFTPSEINVPVGTRLIIELTNTDPEQTHDLVFENGTGGKRLAPGDSETIDVGVITGDLDGWCSIIGHKQMGMTMRVVASGAKTEANAGDSSSKHDHMSGNREASDDAIDLMGEPGKTFTPIDARLDPLPASTGPTTHKVTLTARDTVQEVAPGVTQTLWTFDDTAPGPVLHGRVGDTFEVTLKNDASMGHSIDFHAGALAPDKPMRTIQPGEQLEYTFTATRSGIWMYHCSTMPMSAHIANGMYGAVVIEPENLPEVDHSYVLVQGEYYLGDHDAGDVDVEKVSDRNPDLVVFNGYANQYDHEPLTAKVGERVRLWVLDAGIERPSSFHVVGGQFDTVWSEGRYLIDRETDTGSQALALLPAQGGFTELTFPEAGNYPFVSHYMVDAERGAHGTVHVSE